MANITLSLPNEIQQRMKDFPEVRWSEVARQAIVRKLDVEEQLRHLSAITKDVRISDKEILEFSKTINKAATERFWREHRSRHEHCALCGAEGRNHKKNNS